MNFEKKVFLFSHLSFANSCESCCAEVRKNLVRSESGHFRSARNPRIVRAIPQVFCFSLKTGFETNREQEPCKNCTVSKKLLLRLKRSIVFYYHVKKIAPKSQKNYEPYFHCCKQTTLRVLMSVYARQFDFWKFVVYMLLLRQMTAF